MHVLGISTIDINLQVWHATNDINPNPGVCLYIALVIMAFTQPYLYQGGRFILSARRVIVGEGYGGFRRFGRRVTPGPFYI